MARRSQPYRVEWPLSAEQMEHIDEMFQILFDDTDNGTMEISADQITSGILVAPRGGTDHGVYVIGDLLYASDTDALSRLADVATGNALISGGVGIAPSWGKIGLTTHVSGVLPVANGGTNISSYTVGDLLYASGATTLSKLLDVATGNALISGGVATAPSWGKIGLTTHISGVLPVANGGTNISAYTIGDLLYASTSGVLSLLADIATGNALISGGVTTAPAWGKIGLTTHVSGTLPVANGGTNKTSWTAGSVVFAEASGSALAEDNTKLFWNDSTDCLSIGATETTAVISGATFNIRIAVHDDTTTASPMTLHKHTADDSLGVTIAGIIFARSRGTEASEAVVGNGDLLGGIGFAGFDSVDYEYGAQILVTVQETTPASNKMGGKLIIKTTPAGSATPTTALTIDNAQITTLANPLPVASGGTNIASYAVGDILYASGTTTLSKLADVATGNALISGGVTTAPSWGKIGLTTHVSGTLPVANGGTGVTNIDGCRATNSSGGTQTIANNTVVAVTFNAEDFDTNGMHSTSSATTKITAQRSGMYQVTGGVLWTAGTIGTNVLLLTRLSKNGTVIEGSRSYFPPIASFGTNGQGQNVSSLVFLTASDYVELEVFRANDAVNGLTLTLDSCSLQAIYVGP